MTVPVISVSKLIRAEVEDHYLSAVRRGILLGTAENRCCYGSRIEGLGKTTKIPVA